MTTLKDFWNFFACHVKFARKPFSIKPEPSQRHFHKFYFIFLICKPSESKLARLYHIRYIMKRYSNVIGVKVLKGTFPATFALF